MPSKNHSEYLSDIPKEISVGFLGESSEAIAAGTSGAILGGTRERVPGRSPGEILGGSSG